MKQEDREALSAISGALDERTIHGIIVDGPPFGRHTIIEIEVDGEMVPIGKAMKALLAALADRDAEVARLRDEVEQWKTVSAAGVRPDIHAWMVHDRDRLRAQLDGVIAAIEAEPTDRSNDDGYYNDGFWDGVDRAKASIIARIKGGGVTTSTVKTGKELCDACSRFENQVCTWGCDVLMEGEFCDDWGRAR